MTILVVDDDEALRSVLVEALRKRGHDVDGARGDQDLPRSFPACRYDVVLLDLKLTGADGLEILSRIRESCPETLVIIMTAFGGAEAAMEAMRSGAHDFLEKPFSLTILELRLERALMEVSLRRANGLLRGQLDISSEELVGRDSRMLTLRENLIRFSRMDSPVLFVGESGTGKKTAARSLTAYSKRCEAPFAMIDCSGFSESELQERLFGDEKRGAPGGFSAQRGLFEISDGGTVFLDEVDAISKEIQKQLLVLIEKGEITRAGGDHPVRVNVRILAATRKELGVLVEKGVFMKELFFRLNPLLLTFPPLRQRVPDLGILSETILARLGSEMHRRFTLEPGVLPLFEKHSWPGNLRELKNVLEGMAVHSVDGLMGVEDLPREFHKVDNKGVSSTTVPQRSAKEGGLRQELLDEERRKIGLILERVRGNRTQAAKILGMKRSSLNYRLRKLGLECVAPKKIDGADGQKEGRRK
jgi:two-component system response regulator AtoC